MNHIWVVTQDGKELGTVEAISRKGACHEAYAKFNIPHHMQKAISVSIQMRDTIRHRSGLVIGVDPVREGSDRTAVLVKDLSSDEIVAIQTAKPREV